MVMYNLILTSLGLLGASIHTHFAALNYKVFGDAMSGDYHFATFGSDDARSYSEWSTLYAEDVQLVCASRSLGGIEYAPRLILEQYLKENITVYWQARNPKASCILIDSSKTYMFVIGDSMASLPLWYAFKAGIADGSKTEFGVSSDLLTITHLGFKHVASVGPGMTLCIGTLKNNILAVNHWTDYLANGRYAPSIEDAPRLSLRLLSEVNTALRIETKSHAGGSLFDPFISELDVSDSCSLLMECSLSMFHAKEGFPMGGLSSNRSVFKTQALMADYRTHDDLIDPYTLGKLLSSSKDLPI